MNRLRSFVLALMPTVLMGTGAFAQVDPAPAAEPADTGVTQAQTTPTTTAPRDDGFDWGWINLLGLLGLAGLMRREPRPVHRDTATPAAQTDAPTTPRGGAR